MALDQLTDNSIWNTEEILGISSEDIQLLIMETYLLDLELNVWKIEETLFHGGEGIYKSR